MGIYDPGRGRGIISGPPGMRGSVGPPGPPGPPGPTGGIQTLVAGANITIDFTDPMNPVISATGGGGSVMVTSVNGKTGDVILTADDVGSYGVGDIDLMLADKTTIVDVESAFGTLSSQEIADGIDDIPRFLTGIGAKSIVDWAHTNVPTPVSDSDAASKGYVDSVVGEGGGGGGSGGNLSGSIQFVLDGEGSVLSTGTALDIEIPFDVNIHRVTVLCDQAGDLELGFLCDPLADFPPTTSIAGTAVVLDGDQVYRDTDLVGWDDVLPAGSILRINVVSVATITRATVSISAVATAPEPEVPSSGYADLILNTSGLLAYWRFQEEISPLMDHTNTFGFAAGGAGTLNLGEASLLTGDAGDASIYTSQTAMLTIDHNAAFNITGDTTIECWARQESALGTSTVVGKSNGNTSTNREYRINFSGSEDWRASVYTADGSVHVVGPTAVPGQICHLALVVEGSNLSFWVNGTMYGPEPITGALIATSGPLQVGMFNGIEGASVSVDELAFYDVALTETQLQAHYDEGRGV